MPKEYTPLLEQMAKLIGTYEGDDGNEYVDEDWDLHIPLCQKLLQTVADHLMTVADEAWKEYCEASLDLSNQDDVGEDAPWLECADGFKDLPDDDADLIDSSSRVG